MIGGWPVDPVSTSVQSRGQGTAGRHTVRAPITRIVGRDALIADLVALLDRDDTRLVTLTGPGGIGKTRLAREVALRVQDDFAHGACFVSLASIREPAEVPGAVAEALGLRERGDQSLTEAIAIALRSRHLLLVLDSFEHVAAASVWLARLLAACPLVKALVTSRALLRVQGEWHIPVPSLIAAADDSGRPVESPAMELFVERASAIRSDFSLTEADAEAVRDICRRLDGLPLAIELAATRVAMLPPAAILARLTGRLALLTSNMRDAPSRHRTMRSAIAWSYDLLLPDARQLFRRLAIFAGTFTLADAVAVGLEVGAIPKEGAAGVPGLDRLQEIASLLDQSLIQQVPSEHGESRFRMLGTIREFGLEQLAASGERDEVARRHAGHLLALVERAAPELTGPEQVQWLNRLGWMHDDIRRARAWTRQHGEHEQALRLAIALWPYAYTRGYYSEIRTWLDEALVANPEPTIARAEALYAAGVLATVQGELSVAHARHTEAWELSSSLGYIRGVADALNGLGSVAEEYPEERQLAYRRYEEARNLYREIGHLRSVAVMLINLGNLHWKDGELDEAIACQREAGDLFREVGGSRGAAWSETNLGSIAIEQGDLAGAAGHLREAIELYRDLGDQAGIIEALERFADIAGANGQAEQRVRLLGAAAGMREAINLPVLPSSQARYERALAELRRQLGETFGTWWRAGRSLGVDEAIAMAMASEEAVSEQPVTAASGTDAEEARGLSPRELDVLRLMADGLTNQEIAERLYVSTRTVASHASHILTKLDAPTRTAAVAYAIRNDLA